MWKKLIVVADDYGFSEAYSLGALKAYQEGIVTSLSLMSNMEAAPFAVSLAQKEAPEACLVQHINFVQGRPCSEPESIPSLVDKNGLFYRSNRWKPENPLDTKSVGNVVVTKEDCKTETLSQMKRFEQLTGKSPIHIEGHSVLRQAVTQAFNEVALQAGIHCMTMPEVETKTTYAAHELMMDMKNGMEILNRGSRPEDFFQDAFGILKSEFEFNILHFHPGYLDAYVLENTSLTTPRCYDLQTLCDPRVRTWLEQNNIELVDFTEIYK